MSGAATLSLHPDHLADLRKSGLADDMIRAAGLYSVRPCDLSRIIGFAPQGVTSALAFPYLGDGRFIRVKVFPSYRDKGGHTIKYLQRQGTGARLYIPPGCEAVLRNASIPFAITEGEKKALKLTQEGTLALGIGGLWNWFAQGEPIPDLDKVTWRGRPITVYPDSDVWGRPDLLQAVFAFGKELEERGAMVRVVVIPHGEQKQGIDDYLQAGGAMSNLEAIPLSDPRFTSTARWWEGWRANNGANRQESALTPEPSASGVPVIIKLSEVKSIAVRWLWQDRIALGKLTIIDGDPGLGKSTVLLDIGARLSRGAPMPDGAHGIRGGVVILTLEDGLADTVRPRLEAAGADLTRIVALEGVKRADGQPRIPTIEDIGAITQACGEVTARLVMIDPFMGYLPSSRNSWRDQDVRGALGPLARMAEKLGVAVVLIRHLNKASGSAAIYRGGGSIGIAGACRAALLIAKDPEAEDRRVMACVKTNLGRLPPSLRYAIEEVQVEGAGGVARIVWEGVSTHTADDLLAAQGPHDDKPALDEAREFLREILSAGPVSAKEIQRLAREAGVTDRTLQRAKKVLGVQAKKGTFRGGWAWELAEDGQDPPKMAIQNDGDLGSGLATFAGEEVCVL